MSSHLEQKLQQDIDHIRDRVREMADLALRGLEDSIRALTTQDTKLAYAAILRDSRVDDLEGMVDALCVEFIVRHIPVATHLRFVHSRVIAHAEEIAFYGGHETERRGLAAAYGAVARVADTIYKKKLAYVMLEQFLMKARACAADC